MTAWQQERFGQKNDDYQLLTCWHVCEVLCGVTSIQVMLDMLRNWIMIGLVLGYRIGNHPDGFD